MSRITIDVTGEQHQRIKVLASLQNKTIKELLLGNLEENIERNYNPQTLKALDDVQNQKGLRSYSSAQKLFKRLGI